MTIPRRSIADLQARYALEPGLRDIYVEGSFDVDVLTEALAAARLNQVAVYPIDSIEVPATLLAQHNLFTGGNRSRVIVLARELGAAAGTAGVRCIADRDLGHWCGPLENAPRLIWTDCTSIEVYFFEEAVLESLVCRAARVKCDWPTVFASVAPVLQRLFAARLADHELGWALRWISPDRCMSVAGSRLVLDWNDYVNRLLMTNARLQRRVEFEACCDVWIERIAAYPRLSIRGHDLVDSLAHVVRELNGEKAFTSPDVVARGMVLLAPKLPELLRLAAGNTP